MNGNTLKKYIHMIEQRGMILVAKNSELFKRLERLGYRNEYAITTGTDCVTHAFYTK